MKSKVYEEIKYHSICSEGYLYDNMGVMILCDCGKKTKYTDIPFYKGVFRYVKCCDCLKNASILP